jgi:PKD repeat protein
MKPAAKVAVLAAIVLAFFAAPAMAKLVTLPNGHGISIMPRPRAGHAQPRRTAAPNATLVYAGGPVLHTNNTVAIYWDPSGHHFSSSAFEPLVNRFLGDVAHDSGTFGNAYSVTTQYGDFSAAIQNQSSFVGTVDDTTGYPTSGNCIPAAAGDAGDPCLTDAQLQAEIQNQIAAHHVPGSSPTTMYFVFLPQNVITCGSAPSHDCSDDAVNGFCAEHNMSSNNYPFAVVLDDPTDCSNNPPFGGETFPNDANVDPAITSVSHEHIEAITDPDPVNNTAWFDPNNNSEIADDCEFDYGSPLGGSGTTAFNQLINAHPYSLQEEWSNEDGACVQYDPLLAPGFSNGSAVATQPTTFEATTQRNPHAGYSWSFGDGAGALGQTTSHAYPAPGTYTTTLTVTTDGGRSASLSRAVSVAIPPPSAAFTISPLYPRARQRIRFNPSPSRAPFATITGYAWNFGDRTTASGPSPTHKFRRNGDHFVTLTITTSAGASSTITQRVPIGDPAAAFSISGTRRAHQRLSFAASASDPDGHVTHFAWDFGDGHHASGRRTAHVYSRRGAYTVALTVTDSDRTRTVVTRRVRIGRARSRAAAALARLLTL